MALIVCSALIAALNPCTLSVLIMSITSLSGKGKRANHTGMHTLAFSGGVFVANALAGLSALLVLGLLPTGILGYIALFVASALCLFGLFEIKDYFWYGKGWSFTLSKNSETKVHMWTKKHHSHGRGFLLGLYTSFKLAHYTVILVIMNALLGALLSPGNLFVPTMWAFWYVLPMLFIAVLIFSGARAENLLSWKEQSKHTMRLSIGLLYVLLGWIVLVLLAGGLKLV
jgi:MFS family permease